MSKKILMVLMLGAVVIPSLSLGAEEINQEVASITTNQNMTRSSYWHTMVYDSGAHATIKNSTTCDQTGYDKLNGVNSGSGYEYMWLNSDVDKARYTKTNTGHAEVNSHIKRKTHYKFEG